MRIIFVIFISLFLLFSNSCQGYQKIDPEKIALIDDLKKELEITRKEIEEASKKDKELAGGLLKAIISMRIEILKTNEALIQQRIHALESGAKIKIEVLGTIQDEKEAALLEKEIKEKRAEIETQKQEAQRYSGGLILAMKEASIATNEYTIAMLEQRRLIAKYGLFYRLEAPRGEEIPVKVDEKEQIESLSSEKLIGVKLLKKYSLELDYRDYVLFDLELNPIGIKKPTRSVKGFLIFCDLFGEELYRIRYTINNPLKPGVTLVERGIGFEYNKFMDKHVWVKDTDIKDMVIKFQVQSILYEDGERVDY